MAYLISSLVVGGGMLLVISMFYDLPRERMLKRENRFLENQYDLMNRKLDQALKVLDEIQNRDDNIYRVIFEAEPVPSSLRNAGFGGVNRYADLEGYSNSEVVAETAKKLDNILNKLYVQSKSYDEVFELAKNKELMLLSIPSIMPMSVDEYQRVASYFSHQRLHPILKIQRPHTGVDFTAPVGTLIRATGDGTIREVTLSRAPSGYGTSVLIDHGFTYETFYAHLNRVLVKEGQRVKRGDVIGEVGNTGLSVAPHLHYEVRKSNHPVDPINYFFKEISAEEYQQMIELSKLGGQSLD